MTSKEDLLRLALEGLAAHPPDRLGDLCTWCRDWCLAAENVRYCALADALQIAADWFDERDPYGGVHTWSVEELDRAFERIPAIVDEQETSVAVAMAQALRDEVADIVGRGEARLNDKYS